MSRIFYILTLSAKHGLLEVRINDMVVLANNVEDTYTINLPLNNLIPSTGMQELLCTLKPNLGNNILEDDCMVEGAINRTVVNEELTQVLDDKQLIQFHFDSERPSYEPLSFFADTPYELNIYNDAVNLTHNVQLPSLIADTYRRLNALLENQQYDLFIQELMAHDNNLARSLYWKVTPDITLWRQDQIKMLLESGFRLMPPDNSSPLTFYGYGYLVRPMAPDGNTALRLYHPSGDQYDLDLYFRLQTHDNHLTLI